MTKQTFWQKLANFLNMPEPPEPDGIVLHGKEAEEILIIARDAAAEFGLGWEEPGMVRLYSKVAGREPYYLAQPFHDWREGILFSCVEISAKDRSVLCVEDREPSRRSKQTDAAIALVRDAAKEKGMRWEGRENVTLYAPDEQREPFWMVQSNYGSPLNPHVYGEVSMRDGSLLLIEERDRWKMPTVRQALPRGKRRI
jgi:hypothetical protein